MCGDNLSSPVPAGSPTGIPPRVWGQLAGADRNRVQPRNTPTCVGTTSQAAQPPTSQEEYPHVCGDNSSTIWVAFSAAGTPPRMWGQLLFGFIFSPFVRNTPTYVGTTAPAGVFPWDHKEHPHVCGDNSSTIWVAFSAAGTPPRMWGQRNRDGITIRRHRNTPTYVGTTNPPIKGVSAGAEHPHVCGDNGGPGRHGGAGGGTPPRMWGQQKSLSAQI